MSTTTKQRYILLPPSGMEHTMLSEKYLRNLPLSTEAVQRNLALESGNRISAASVARSVRQSSLKVIDSDGDEGPKLVEASELMIAALRASSFEGRIVPEVRYRLAAPTWL